MLFDKILAEIGTNEELIDLHSQAFDSVVFSQIDTSCLLLWMKLFIKCLCICLKWNWFFHVQPSDGAQTNCARLKGEIG